MKRLLICTMLLALAMEGSCQFIFRVSQPIKTFVESIDPYEIINRKEPIPYAAIRIIDSRYDTTSLGFHRYGFLQLNDSSQPAALQHVVDQYFSSLYTPGRDTLVLQLELLSIQDAVIKDPAYILTEAALICQKYEGGHDSYKYLGMMDTLLSETFSYKTTPKAHKNGKHRNAEFWDYYLLRLLEAALGSTKTPAEQEGEATLRYMTLDAIKWSGLQKRNRPILKAEKINPGIYRSFFEFSENQPSVYPDSMHTLNQILESMHYRTGKKGTNLEPDTTCWGFSDGHNVFVRYNYDFFQLERRDARYYLAPTPVALQNDAAMRKLSFFLSLFTAAVDVIAANNGIYNGIPTPDFGAAQSPYIPMVTLRQSNALLLGLTLDLQTGLITF